MRKLILISALLAASTAFALAGKSRSLSLTGAGNDRTGKADRPGLDATRPGGHRSGRDRGSGSGSGLARHDDRDHQAEPKADTRTTETKPAKTVEEGPSRRRRSQGPPYRRQVWRLLVSRHASIEVPRERKKFSKFLPLPVGTGHTRSS